MQRRGFLRRTVTPFYRTSSTSSAVAAALLYRGCSLCHPAPRRLGHARARQPLASPNSSSPRLPRSSRASSPSSWRSSGAPPCSTSAASSRTLRHLPICLTNDLFATSFSTAVCSKSFAFLGSPIRTTSRTTFSAKDTRFLPPGLFFLPHRTESARAHGRRPASGSQNTSSSRPRTHKAPTPKAKAAMSTRSVARRFTCVLA
eukprot:Rmarinus@m.12265